MPRKYDICYVKNNISSISNNEYLLLDDVYVNSKTKMNILHIKCGNIFKMNYNNFYNGQKCPICSKKNAGKLNMIGLEKYKKYVLEETSSEFIITDDKYINNKTKIEILHKKCGKKFKTTPNNFNKTKSCYHCAYDERAKKLKLDYDYVKNKIFNLSNDKYELLDDKYKNSSTKMNILHKKCGKHFKVTYGNFTTGSRCPYCNESKGEKIISTFLEKNNIEFQPQYTFDDLTGRTNRKLRFDFAIIKDSKLKFLIEYDGIFHYKKVHKNHDFKAQKRNDSIKNDYCNKNCLKLIRIPYTEFDNIEKILYDLIS